MKPAYPTTGETAERAVEVAAMALLHAVIANKGVLPDTFAMKSDPMETATGPVRVWLHVSIVPVKEDAA